MRALNITLAIVISMLAYELIAETNTSSQAEFNQYSVDRYGYEGNRTMWAALPVGYTPPLTRSSSELADLNSTDINGTLQDILTSPESISGSGITDWLGGAAFLLRMGNFFIKVLWNSTLGFGGWIRTFGTAYELIPANIAATIGVLVNMVHVIGIFQMLTKGDVRAGA